MYETVGTAGVARDAGSRQRLLARPRPHPRVDAASAGRPVRRAAWAGLAAGEDAAGYHTAMPVDSRDEVGAAEGTVGWAGTAGASASPTSPRGREAAVRLARCVSTPGSALGAALGALAAALDALADVDVDAEHPEVVGDALVATTGLATRLHAGVLGLLDSFDQRHGWAADGAVTAASWLAARTGSDQTAAAGLVHTARRLRALPRLGAHLAAGDITPAHAAAVAAAATPHRAGAISAAQDILCDLACTNPPRDLRHALRALAEAADPDGADRDDPDGGGPPGDPLRELRLGAGYAGRGELHATLDPLTREALVTLLDAFATPDPNDTPDEQRRTPTQRRHDAFAAMLHTLLAQPRLPSVQGARPHILITIDLAALLDLPPEHPAAHTTLADIADLLGIDLTHLNPTDPDAAADADADADTDTVDAEADATGTAAADAPQADTDGTAPADTADAADTADTADTAAAGVAPPAQPAPVRPPRFGSGVPADPALIRGLLPAATIMAVLTLGPWRVVNVGATHRTLPAWLRAVLIAMHQHCRGPDCDRPANWTDAHHITPWATAFTTDLNDTLPLCAGKDSHHRLIDQGWTATLDHTTGNAIWTSPTGRTITVPPPQPPPQLPTQETLGDLG